MADDLPPVSETLLRTNAWCSGAASSPVGAEFDGWGLTKVERSAGAQPLSSKEADYTDWRDPRVGWGIILAESKADAKDKARGLDAPSCIRTLIAERSKAFAAQGGVPVFRYRKDSGVGLLRRYAPDGTPSDPGLGGARGVGPNAVPWYLLIVGSPQEIPWRVQYRLQLDAYVGRLDLEPQGLERYVEALLGDWSGSSVQRSKPVFWAVDHGVQDITRLMRRTIAEKLAREFIADPDNDFDMAGGMLSDDDATHANLNQALHDRRPAFVVTTSHGVMEPPNDPASLAVHLGLPLDAAHEAMDLETATTAWSPHGVIWYAQACCSAGCERQSSFAGATAPGSTLAAALTAVSAIGPCTSPFPQRLLGGESPARAFVGHVEPTFDWTLRDIRNGQTVTAPIVDAFYGQLHLAKRPPLGYAMRVYHRGTGGLWRDYHEAIDDVDDQQPEEDTLRRTKLVASDREALVLLGDPTVRCQ